MRSVLCAASRSITHSHVYEGDPAITRKQIEKQRSRLDPTAEYQTLREELLQSRRYVFERPLLIAALGVAAIKEGALLILYPPVLAGLLLFNFWFTVNRLLSSARIVAYIQLVLEEGSIGYWRGWETSLRKYRIWHRTDLEAKQRMVSEELARSEASDALMYYPAIFRLHVFLIASSAVGSLAAAKAWPGPVSIVCAFLTWVFAVFFAHYCFKWKPSKMQTLIERNRIIWRHVLGSTERK